MTSLIEKQSVVARQRVDSRLVGDRADRVLLVLLLFPVLLLFVWLLYIIGLQGVNSLRNYNLAKPWLEGFAGLRNYQRLLSDQLFWASLKNTAVWTVGSVGPQLLLGMVLAFLLNQKFPLRGLYRAIVLSPWAVSGVVGALIWTWILHGPFGVINDMLNRSGIIRGYPAWLSNPQTAMGGVVLANVWRGIPFFAVSILAGLQAISEEMLEAAEIDGASGLQKLCYVVLPMLKGVITVTTLLRIVWTWNWIETVLVMTGGGPANATLILPLYIFNQFFLFSDIGYSSAIAVFDLILLAGFSFIYLRLLQSE